MQRGHRAARVVGGVGALFLVALAALAAWSFFVEPRWLQVEHIEAPLPGLSSSWDGERIAVLGDMQVGMFLDNERAMRAAVDEAIAHEPAAAILLGDFVYRSGDAIEEVEHAVHLVRPLTEAGIPTYAVLGNHDWGVSKEKDRVDVKQGMHVRRALEEAGIVVLHNKAVPLATGPGAPWLVGVGSEWAGFARPDVALRLVPDDAPRIVVMHNPETFPRLQAYEAPVAFAGHTHGGQLRLPFLESWSWLGLVREGVPPVDGWVEMEYGATGNRLYINRGIGMGVLPVRFNCRPELTVVSLERAPAEAHSTPR